MMRAAQIVARPARYAWNGGLSSSVRRNSNVKDLPVLVTGARGRVGGQLVKELVKKGRKVLATGRNVPEDPEAIWGPNSAKFVEFVKADLLDRAAIDSLVARSGDVLHIGALPGPSHQPPPGIDPSWGSKEKSPVGLEKETGLQLLEQNIVGTCALFESIARKRDGCRVVFASSLFACGFAHDPKSFQPPVLPLEETMPLDHLPLEHYGFSKFVAENFASMLVRSADGAGAPGKSPQFVHIRFSNMIKVENWDTLPAKGADRTTPLMWTYVHEHDVVDAHLKALELPGSTFPTKNETFFIIADDNRTDMRTEELISGHWAQNGTAAPELSRPLPGFTSIASNAKAKKLLGWSPRSFRK